MTFKINSHFMVLDPDWAIFQSLTAQKPSKMRGLELPVNKALPTEISFWDFLYTIRHTKCRDLANKNPETYKKVGQK